MGTVSIINLKGSVGKTVTSINMAYGLMRRGRCALLDALALPKEKLAAGGSGTYDEDDI